MAYYVFGIIRGNGGENWPHAELNGKSYRVLPIETNQMAAVVADVNETSFDPSRKNARTHQKITSEAHTRETFLPMSFGTVLQEKKDVKKLLTTLRPQAEKMFPKLENRMEVGLRLTADETYLRELASRSPVLKNIKAKQQKKGQLHFGERLEAGEASAAFMKELHENIQQSFFKPLSKIADSVKSNDLMHEKMVMNASFLVHEENEEAFDEEVNRLHDEWKEKLSFTYTGPWPPFNFVDIQMKAGR
ncbi:GvpL/GvpF family gas vesicle protein [Alkalicoccus urumqiensis]|uniref:Gas vesicle protein GvpF n=1 Tax=Alkalicoccus urumqiensis TaxID=1548213 RepID=A0A2P6MIR3_ALKUR|nr:GvpL/GvpF family gas vesicle protein [Alkalicoccus urumqiensis]PRO66184.1 hypothetical protein C6I21_05110 [Alkalicoccus urumqiensis]